MSTQPLASIESPSYYFNARELARLAVYRAAIIAQFYTDQCDAPGKRSSGDLARLFEVEAATEPRPDA